MALNVFAYIAADAQYPEYLSISVFIHRKNFPAWCLRSCPSPIAVRYCYGLGMKDEPLPFRPFKP